MNISHNELLSLEVLEPFGWIFTPGPLPGNFLSAADALEAAGAPSAGPPPGEISVASGRYTEKGRYRQELNGRRVTLYFEHPVWVVTLVPEAGEKSSGESPKAARYARHTLVDAHTGRLITQFLLMDQPGELHVLDLHEPLTDPEMSPDEATAAAIAGEERVLTGLAKTVEYGSRWRLIPGFVQVTDVWRVTFDTSSLPPISSTAKPELAWVVMVDDKARHRWLSAAVEEGSQDTG